MRGNHNGSTIRAPATPQQSASNTTAERQQHHTTAPATLQQSASNTTAERQQHYSRAPATPQQIASNTTAERQQHHSRAPATSQQSANNTTAERQQHHSRAPATLQQSASNTTPQRQQHYSRAPTLSCGRPPHKALILLEEVVNLHSLYWLLVGRGLPLGSSHLFRVGYVGASDSTSSTAATLPPATPQLSASCTETTVSPATLQ
eukprot:gene31268-6412_t